MIRLMSYLLTIVMVIAFLTVVIPFALLAADAQVKDVLDAGSATNSIVDISAHVPRDLQFFKIGGSLSSMIVLMIGGYILLFIQQYF